MLFTKLMFKFLMLLFNYLDSNYWRILLDWPCYDMILSEKNVNSFDIKPHGIRFYTIVMDQLKQGDQDILLWKKGSILCLWYRALMTWHVLLPSYCIKVKNSVMSVKLFKFLLLFKQMGEHKLHGKWSCQILHVCTNKFENTTVSEMN